MWEKELDTINDMIASLMYWKHKCMSCTVTALNLSCQIQKLIRTHSEQTSTIVFFH